MNRPSAWPTPGRRRRRPGALWQVSIAVTALWALAGALLCAATFAMSLQPPENPADAAPFPATLWYPVLLLAGLASLALAPSPAVALITGLAYLRRVQLTGRRWQAAWVASSVAAAAAEALLLRAVIVTFRYTGSALRQPNWGPPVLSAAFVTTGAAMIAMLAAAARTSASLPPAPAAAGR